MNGQMMKCNTYENRKRVEKYLKMFNPYESKPSIGIDLVAVSRYAKEHDKKLDELTEHELVIFKKNQSKMAKKEETTFGSW